MKPDFALSLSSEGLCLLQRAGSNWVLLDQVYIADADFVGRMEALRTLVKERSQNSSGVKLVIPNDQIKYYSLSRPKDASPDDIERMIQLSLEAETPYRLDQIGFDWVSNVDTIYVAAVARQTLHEAEDFATLQGFLPLGNVGIAPDGEFIGEVFFGLANGAAPLMECDANPIKIVYSALPSFHVAGESVEVSVENFEDESSTSEIFESRRDGALRNSSEKTNKTARLFNTLIIALADMTKRSFQGSAVFFENILKRILQVLLRLRGKELSYNRLIRAGHLSTAVLAFVILALIGGLSLYKANPEKWATTDDPLVLDKAPQVQTETQLLSKGIGLSDFAQISNPSPDAQHVILTINEPKKQQLSHLSLMDERYDKSHSNPIRPNWITGPRTVSRKDIRAEPESAAPPEFQITAFQSLKPLQAPPHISKPAAPLSFKFIKERLNGIYAISGVWSFSPRIPFMQVPFRARNPVVGKWEPLVRRPLSKKLSHYEVFEKALLVDQDPPDKKPVIFGLDIPVIRTTKEVSLSAYVSGSSMSQHEISSLDPPDQISSSTILPIGLTPQDKDKTRITARSFDDPLNPSTRILHKPQIGVDHLSKSLPSKPIAQINILNRSGIQTRANSIDLVALTPPDLAIDQIPTQTASLNPIRPDGFATQEETTLPFIDFSTSSIPKATEENRYVLRPKPRPETINPIEPETYQGAVVESLRPKARPKIKKPTEKTVEVASASAILPEEEGEEASASLSSTKATNTTISGKKATIKRALNLREVNLLGVYYFRGKRSALVRLKNGKRLMVKVGDRLDGGKVAAIGKRELRYVKSGKNITLDLLG